MGKSGIPNGGNAVRYGYAGKAGTLLKSEFCNAGNSVRYGYTSKAGAIVKSPLPDSFNAVGYDYAGNVFVFIKSIPPNAGNRSILYACWNTDYPSCSGISANYRAAFYIIVPVNFKIAFGVVRLGAFRLTYCIRHKRPFKFA